MNLNVWHTWWARRDTHFRSPGWEEQGVLESPLAGHCQKRPENAHDVSKEPQQPLRTPIYPHVTLHMRSKSSILVLLCRPARASVGRVRPHNSKLTRSLLPPFSLHFSLPVCFDGFGRAGGHLCHGPSRHRLHLLPDLRLSQGAVKSPYQHDQSICRAFTRMCGAWNVLLLCRHLFACVAWEHWEARHPLCE